jgi:cell division septation protein DedD
MIKEHILEDGTKRFQVYARARVRDKRTRVYVGTFASRREAQQADANTASRSA